MRPAGAREGQDGFTLLELLVALSIFAVVSVMAYEAIAALFTAEDRVGAQQARLAEVERAVTLLSRDLQDVAPRPTRTVAGPLQAALTIGAGQFTLTRAGWSNPAGMRRSSYQRVAYAVTGQSLTRTFWQTLDSAGSEEGLSAVLLSGVRNFTLRVRRDGEWTDSWPPELAVAPPDPEAEREAASALPEAAEFTMDVDGFGRVRRLVIVGPR